MGKPNGAVISDELTERLWDVIATVRDASPRYAGDADTHDLIEAARPVIAEIVAAELERLADSLQPVPPSADGPDDRVVAVRQGMRYVCRGLRERAREWRAGA